MNPPFELTILGTSSASPTRSRHPSAQILKLDGSKFLIDCGEGTQRQLILHGIRHSRINHILISHMHGDHFFGLPGLLSTMNLGGRTEPITIAGPERLQEVIELLLDVSAVNLEFAVNYIITNSEQPQLLLETKDCSVHTLPLQHRIPCTGFLFREKITPRKLNREACNLHDIPYQAYDSLLQGADYYRSDGTIIANAELTTPGRKGRSYAYISDTLPQPHYASMLSDVDLLYHESTFMHDLLDRAAMTFHSTARQAAEMAVMYQAKQLLIGHFSARYRDAQMLLDEARNTFPPSIVAEEGSTYQIGM